MLGNPFGLCSRRHFVRGGATGIGSLALNWLLNQQGLLAAPVKPELDNPTYDLTPKIPHFAAKAKAMISIFMFGGPSNIDLFGHKPKLREYDGKPFPGKLVVDNPVQQVNTLMGPGWKFKKWGQSGMEISELLPHIGEISDEITLIRSLVTGVNNHVPSAHALNTGRAVPSRATLGAWLTYGLGTENANLPAFVNLTDPQGMNTIGGEMWTNGFLPSLYQATMVRATEPRIPNLDPPARLKGAAQSRQLEFLRSLNARHLEAHPGESDLEARIASYELAARMQTAAKEGFEISQESKHVHRLYGIDEPKTRDYGTRCLIARRLVERGVRFVQILNAGQSWDHHAAIRKYLPESCRAVDKPSAALVKDLKARGLLHSTVVFWGSEMGRLPIIQAVPGGTKEKYGRDHNTNGFSVWMAGGGLKKGHVHG
jgi:hypothetical protein